MSNEVNSQEIAIIINGLTDEDVNCKIHSVKNLPNVGKALGPERTRLELLPFATSVCCDDEDEILSEFALVLREFPGLIGDLKNISVVLSPLELLCKVEEGIVRDRAIVSIIKVIEYLIMENEKKLIEKHVWPIVEKMAENRWYTSRSSACALFPSVYSHVSKDIQQMIIRFVVKLSSDTMPMVRRYVTKNLGRFCNVVPKEHVLPEKQEEELNLFKVFDTLRVDDQDSVRLLSIDCAIEISKLLSEEQVISNIIPMMKVLGKDKSWRVRYMVAAKYAKFCAEVGQEMTNQQLMALYSNLCLDSEPEVRTAATEQLAGVCKLLTREQVISQILPTVKKLVGDKSEHVRSALASVIMSISPVLGKESTVKHLLSLFGILLKDEVSKVRLNVISRVADLNHVVGSEILSDSGLLSSIVELAEDKQWRVRLSLIEYIPLIARQLSRNHFDDKLKKLCVLWLSDSVFSIRMAAAENIVNLVDIFGEDWAMEFIVPEALKMKSMPNYLFRMVILVLISGLADVCSKPTLAKLLPEVIDMADDPVSNIKFNVAKALTVLIRKLDKKLVIEKVKPCLEKLQKCTDPDVREYAAIGLEKIKK